MRLKFVLGGAVALALIGGPGTAVASPTCSTTLGISNHGQHIVGDYVTGIGHDTLGWPPGGQVGTAVRANGGVVVRGGPGPGFHFPAGFARRKAGNGSASVRTRGSPLPCALPQPAPWPTSPPSPSGRTGRRRRRPLGMRRAGWSAAAGRRT